MCGRYAFFSPAEAVKRAFALDGFPELESRYNIAPTQDVPVVRVNAQQAREAALLHWGLVPHWAKERSIGNRMINARAETIADKPSFRVAFRRRRCLLLASGWYEWQQAGDGKQPWFICQEQGEPLAMAGLWESWQDPAAGTTLESCTIITTEAAASIEDIHHRMPVILPEAHWEPWLDPGYFEPMPLQDMLVPDAGTRLLAWPVSRRVNSPRNEGSGLIERQAPGAANDA